MNTRQLLAEFGDDPELRYKSLLSAPSRSSFTPTDLTRSHLRADAVAVGLLDFYRGSNSDARILLDVAARFGATGEEIEATAADVARTIRMDGGQIDRRTLLRFLGLTAAGTVVAGLWSTRAKAVTPDFWGVDSACPVNEPNSGQNMMQFVHDFYNENPDFWGRYTASPGNSNVNVYAADEGQPLRNRGIQHVPVLTSPTQGRLSGGSTHGTNDANAACDYIVSIVGNNHGDTRCPTTDGYVTLFLDVEEGTTLSQDYWDAWAYTVYRYGPVSSDNSQLPFYVGMYTDPTDSGRCSRMRNSPTASKSVWSSRISYIPDRSDDLPPKKPNWNASVYPDPPGNPYECGQINAAFWQHALEKNWPRLRRSGDPFSVDKDVAYPRNSSFEIHHTLFCPPT